MALSPDGKTLYPILEGPLVGDDPLNRRVYEFDLRERRYTGRTWTYRLTQPGLFVSDAVAYGRDLIVTERDNNQGPAAAWKKAFLVDFPDRKPVLGKRELVDLLNLRDPERLSLPAPAPATSAWATRSSSRTRRSRRCCRSGTTSCCSSMTRISALQVGTRTFPTTAISSSSISSTVPFGGLGRPPRMGREYELHVRLAGVALVATAGLCASSVAQAKVDPLQQIARLQAIKRDLTPGERKLDSRMAVALRSKQPVSSEVDITVRDAKADLTERLRALGANVRYVSPRSGAIRASVPPSKLRTVAGWKEVARIDAARLGKTASIGVTPTTKEERAEQAEQLRAAVVASEGDRAHAADTARAASHVTGVGHEAVRAVGRRGLARRLAGHGRAARGRHPARRGRLGQRGHGDARDPP